MKTKKGELNMNKWLKGIMIALIIFYIVSPVDFCPGPIDDIILALVSVCGSRFTRRIEA